MNTTDQQGEVSRRSFLAKAIGACVAFLATLLGIPAAGAAIGPALRREEARWVQVGRADGFDDGVPTAVEFGITRRDGWVETTETKVVWVLREGGQFTVFNGRCTHLGCAFRWQADRNEFLCPCHDGHFAKDGRVIAGPPPRALDALQTRVEAAALEVQYEDFRLGVSERVAV